ncbi:hypothetical protein GMRT_10250 [Giardia muris]|uniref:Uncharacterized protein n=1 Tax=Giardia muris TaxID=5742 RepID=A0A4Z1T8K2_GIAMU|nr:hypothetical protein GMRT_10250 [Giardia muris]|eukprot:TNJ29457.1 hypothetical protein GMRT_10250 [Giardia muris]
MKEDEHVYTCSPSGEATPPQPYQGPTRHKSLNSDHTAYILRLFFMNLIAIQLVTAVILLCTLAITTRLDHVDTPIGLVDFLHCLSTVILLLKNETPPSSAALLALSYLCVALNLVVCYAGFLGLHRLHIYPATCYLDAIVLTLFVFINNTTVFIPYVVVTASELKDIICYNRIVYPILAATQFVVFVELLLTIVDIYVGITAYSESRLPLKSQSFSSFTWDTGLHRETQPIDLLNAKTNSLLDDSDSPKATTPRPKAV